MKIFKLLQYNNFFQNKSIDYSIPLTFVALEQNTQILLEHIGSEPVLTTIMYRINNSNWTAYTCGQIITLSSINDKLQFKNSGTSFSKSSSEFYIFEFISGSANLEGNLNSLINFSNNLSDYAFNELFQECPIVEAHKLLLPATTLANSCYQYMFYDCKSLTTAPELPASTLADYCYGFMFAGCSRLTSAPELPASTLIYGCYQYMFYNCTSLTTAPELPATNLAIFCYQHMFYRCISLTTAPELPASALIYGCYWNMFNGCLSLSSVRVKFTSWDTVYTKNWLSNVSRTGNFYYKEGLDITQRGASYIPTGWNPIKF